MEAFDDDDDFGEIYADVEVPAPTVTFDLCIEQRPQKQQPPDPNGDGDGDVGEPSKVNGDENDGVCAGSDSDDDGLNIVLNDDGGCNGLPPPVRCDDVDDDADGGGGDRLDDGSELVSKNGVKGGYGPRFFNRKVCS